MKTDKQKNIKKEWYNPKIEKLDICTSTMGKKGNGAETKNPGNGQCQNDGSYCA